MKKLMVLLAVLPALLAAACGDSNSSSTTTTTAATTSSTASGGGAAGGPKIEEFEIAADVKCTSGQPTQAKAKWVTKDATKTRLEVDGKFLKEDGPPSGDAEVPLTCDDKSHKVVLEALNADGKSTSASHTVKTEPSGSGSATGTKPTIDSFSVSLKGCSPTMVDALATWKTEHADAVSLEADGAAAQSGLPAKGDAAISTIPCDGKTHSVTLTASGSGGKVHKSVTVTTPEQG